MELFNPDAIVLKFPIHNPYTGKLKPPTVLDELSLFELNERLLDIQDESKLPVHEDMHVHYQWRLQQLRAAGENGDE